MVWDVAVVGGGCAGLATGALLSHAGHKVVVLERQAKLGGRALSLEQKGFHLNMGLHTPPNGEQGPLYRVLRTVGKLDAVRFAAPELDDSWSVDDNGGLHRMILQPKHFFTSDILSIRSKFKFMGLAIKAQWANPQQLWNVPLGEWLQSLTDDEAVQRFMLDQAMVMMFDHNPAEVSAGQFLESFRGVSKAKLPFFYPYGGWSHIFNALAQRIREGGGEVRTSARVKLLAAPGGRVAEIQLDGGETVQARCYVFTVQPQELPGMISPNALPSDYANRLRTIEPVSVAGVDLGLTRALPVKTAAFHSARERIVVTSYTDPATGLIPPGGQLIQALYFAEPGELNSSEGTEAAHRRLSTFVDRYYRGASQRAEVRRLFSFRSALAARHKVGQAWVDLPGPTVPGVENLFIAGDGTAAPGELSNPAWASAENAAKAVHKYLAGAGALQEAGKP